MSNHDITKTISNVLSELMTTEGIAKHKQSEHIRKVIGISSVQAHRKLNGTVPWDIKQLEKMLLSLNSSLSRFFIMVENNEYNKAKSKVIINGAETDCLLYLSDEEKKETAVVAVKINNNWKTFRTSDAKKNIEFYGNYKNIILIEPIATNTVSPNKSIIILDDDINIVKLLEKELSTYSLDISGYTNLYELDESISKNPADIYILDWVIGSQTVFNSIKMIRESKKPDSLIIVLTGQSGDEVDREILTAIKDYDIFSPLEKPIRMTILKHYIDRYLGEL